MVDGRRQSRTYSYAEAVALPAPARVVTIAGPWADRQLTVATRRLVMTPLLMPGQPAVNGFTLLVGGVDNDSLAARRRGKFTVRIK
jgi:hypothetical protein